MFGFAKRHAQRYHDALVKDANTWQIGFLKFFNDNRRYLQLGGTDEDKAIIGAIVNWVFQFGEYGPKVSQDPSLRRAVDEALQDARRIPADEDRIVELTAAVIIAAAAQDVPMARFETHFDQLHQLGLVMNRINIAGIERRLTDRHKPYYHYMLYGGS